MLWTVMGLRRYADPAGREWNVWDVPPKFLPKRSGADRRIVPVDHDPERRVSGQRRVTDAPPEWVHGWICFQHDEEKLRLCPLPDDWERVPPRQLEVYRLQATRVVRS